MGSHDDKIDWTEWSFILNITITLKVSTVKRLEFTIDSTPESSVIRDSSLELVPCCFSNADSITRAEFIRGPKLIWLPEGWTFLPCNLISSTIL